MSYETTLEITQSVEKWKSFLETAAWQYKYSFSDQVLIYAQRPKAIACATMEQWNKYYHRWVNKNAKGIALIDDRGNDLSLRYVFDIRDTNSFDGNRVYLWQMDEVYEEVVIASLADIYRSVEQEEDEEFPKILLRAAFYGALDNLDKYLTNLTEDMQGSYLMSEEEPYLRQRLFKALWNSVSYMLLTRCGYDPSQYVSDDDFGYVGLFDTPHTVNVLGVATRDISKLILDEIGNTIKSIDREKFAKSKLSRDNKGINKRLQEVEGIIYDGNHIQTGRRLFVAGIESAERPTNYWQIRHDEKNLFDDTSESVILHAADDGRTHEPFSGSGTGSGKTDTRLGGNHETEGRHNRGNESKRPNEMGGLDEQSTPGSRGNSLTGIDLQLNKEEGGIEEKTSVPPSLLENKESSQDLQPLPILPGEMEQLSLFGFPREQSGVSSQQIEDKMSTMTGTDRQAITEEFDSDVKDGILTAPVVENSIEESVDLSNEVAENSEIDIPIGAKLTIDGREFIVEKVNEDMDTVSLRDVTFQNSIGFPIFGEESTDFVRACLEKQALSSTQSMAVEDQPAEDELSKERSVDIVAKNYRITDDNLGEGGAKAKFRNNVAAIQTLKEIEFENRIATPAEQEILSKYVGWGGLPQAFDENNQSWQNEFIELYGLLSPEEYTSARASTLNAHYTSPLVVREIYQALSNLGFSQGNILEPACGVGNFLGMLPDEMQGSNLYGVELDSISGRIAKQLYPESRIEICGFENTAFPDNFFDVAIGNVPFGSYKVSDPKYDKHKFYIHDYFFAKTLDQVRPGGIVAFITFKGTLDKENPAIRKYIAQRADLLGAIRLPNTAFKANAGTEVTTDIIFLQKRDRMIESEPEWIHLNKTETGIPLNQYFIDHPEMVLGEMVFDKSMYGNEKETSCHPKEGRNLADLLHGAIKNIQGQISEYEIIDSLDEEEDKSIPADPSVRNFSFCVVEDNIYYRENSRMNPVRLSEIATKRAIGMIAIRDSTRKLIEYQTENYPEELIADEQKRLNQLYDNFTSKYGLLNSNANSRVFSQDSGYPLLCSLEILDEKGDLKRKADMFFKRTIKPKQSISHVDTASEALAVSLSEKGCIDMVFMGGLTGKDETTLFKELKGIVFLSCNWNDDGSYSYQTADEFLSGNVKEKLRKYEEALAIMPDDGEYTSVFRDNVEALKQVQPVDLKANEISVRLGTTWIPADIVQQFVYELLETGALARGKIKVQYCSHTGDWQISEKGADTENVKSDSTYGTKRRNAYKIIEDSLNLKISKVFDIVVVDGKQKRVLNKKETAIVQAKQELIKETFKSWIWKDRERRNFLTDLYNEQFNCIRAREYDGSHLEFPGMNPEISLRKHQLNAIARILYGGNTLLDHAVGAGKTFEMVAAAMKCKQMGLCNKSLFVVPNHITEQFAAEWLQLYPSANILVATEKDFEMKKRKKFCGRIATGEYDAVIIGHSQLEKIPMSIEQQQAFIEDQIEEISAGIRELKEKKSERFSVKRLEKTKRNLETKLEKLTNQHRKDDVVTFEELGIDRIFVDEAHYFKNLFFYTKMQNVGGIAQSEAQKSSDLFMKCRYLDKLTNNRGTVFATGTPISNSIVELYTMQRYLQYAVLLKYRLHHFDSWASTFGETINTIELAPEGTGYRSRTRFAKFYNIPELMSMFRCVADICTTDMLDLPVPKANYHVVVLPPSEFQKDMVASFAKRAEKIHSGTVNSRIDNMLKITNDGRKLALDQRLINPLLPDNENSKTSVCTGNVFRVWEDTKERKLAQVIFCDLSTPHNDGNFNVYDDIKVKLVAKGVPETEIAFIHDATTRKQKQELFAKVRAGDIRVLIGSTFKMGAGTNAQNKLVALHDLDCPWRPADLEQRLGRIIRQGNENDEVEICRYVTEGTFDAYSYQLLENKQRSFSQIMNSKTPARIVEDVDETALSYAEIKALTTGNPLIIEKNNLDTEVSKLNLLKSNHMSQQFELEDRVLKHYPLEIKNQKEILAGLEKDIATVKLNTPENKDIFPPMTIFNTVYTEKKEAGTAILEACKTAKGREIINIGSYRGFSMALSFSSFTGKFNLTLKNALSHTIDLGSDIYGNITRIDNVLHNFESRYADGQLRLEEIEKQMEMAKEELGKPFPQEDELIAKNIRLAEVNALLNVDEKEDIVFDEEDEEIEENDIALEQKEKRYEIAR